MKQWFSLLRTLPALSVGIAALMLWAASGAVVSADAAGTNAPTVIAPDSSAILYSPYNWLISGTMAKTINSGAYFRTLIQDTKTCVVRLRIGTATPYSQAWARLDGGSWQAYVPTTLGVQTWTLAMPTGTTAAKHLLEFVVKSTTETQDRWNSQATAVEFLGLTLDAGANVSHPAARKYRVLIYGDSITEGVRVNGYDGIPSDTDRNDVRGDYSYPLGELLDAEIGVVGFGATGLTVGGSGSVPPLSTSYHLLWSGQARTFSPVPDLVIYNEGTNERGASLSAMTTALETVVRGIGYVGTTQAGLHGTRHLVLQPFNGTQASNLTAAVRTIGSPNVVYGNTTGFWALADSSDNLHPYAYAHLAYLAPQVAALALPLLHPQAARNSKILPLCQSQSTLPTTADPG